MLIINGIAAGLLGFMGIRAVITVFGGSWLNTLIVRSARANVVCRCSAGVALSRGCGWGDDQACAESGRYGYCRDSVALRLMHADFLSDRSRVAVGDLSNLGERHYHDRP